MIDPIPALEANMRALLRLTSRLPGAEVGLEPDATWGALGIPSPLFNVAIGRFRAADADRRIREVADRFRRRAMPVSWWVLPDSTPADLDRRLVAAGFRDVGRLPGMALDLDGLIEEGLPDGVEIETVRDPAGYAPAADVLVEAFELSGDLRDSIAWVFGHLVTGPGAGSRTVVARLDGEAVATALVVLDPPIAGIYNVAVREVARGRGIGRAVTLEVARLARAAGCRLAVLEASPMGAPIYRRLGFRDVGTLAILGRLSWS